LDENVHVGGARAFPDEIALSCLNMGVLSFFLFATNPKATIDFQDAKNDVVFANWERRFPIQKKVRNLFQTMRAQPVLLLSSPGKMALAFGLNFRHQPGSH